MKIGFIGLGKLGLPCAEVCIEKGHDVFGYDPNVKDKSFCQTSLHQVVKDTDIVFVAVPTPHEKNYGGETPTSHLQPKDFEEDLNKNIRKRRINDNETQETQSNHSYNSKENLEDHSIYFYL